MVYSVIELLLGLVHCLAGLVRCAVLQLGMVVYPPVGLPRMGGGGAGLCAPHVEASLQKFPYRVC
jgi:hypothetical protein